MTKPITAVAAMILMERGMLDLYEPVADILPVFAHQKVERDGKLYTPERPILMHDLLAMTSGLVYPEEQTWVDVQSQKCLRKHVRVWKVITR